MAAREEGVKNMLLLGVVACFIKASVAYDCGENFPFDQCPRIIDPYYETVCCIIDGNYQCCDQTLVALWAWICISVVLIIVIGVLTLILCCVCPCCIIAARKSNRRPPVVVEYTADGAQEPGPATYLPPNSVQPYPPYQAQQGMPEKAGLPPPPYQLTDVNEEGGAAAAQSTPSYGAVAASISDGTPASQRPLPVPPPVAAPAPGELNTTTPQ